MEGFVLSRLKIHENKSNFIRDGKPFFYLADTIWSAFTNVTIEEWEFYLEKRKMQGYNVLQINTLPQWDRCVADTGIYPFASEDGQKFDFSKYNQDYYERAKKMCQMAVDKGFELALVVLWLNYVPGTWGSRMLDMNIMPKEYVKKYTDKVISEFDQFEPIYVVSGDTDFDTDDAIEYYQIALDELCKKSPSTLKTLHIKRGYDVIPEEFLDKIDFYMYQSGHNAMEQRMAYMLPQQISEKYPKKPIVNAEPCYEQMGYSRMQYGRFGVKEIRQAAWSSILSGACAGVTYGAHGIWNWHRINSPKNSVLGEGFDSPNPWQEALQFEGAWDYGFLKYLLEENRVEELIPCQELLENASEEIRIAKTKEGNYFIYVPYSTQVVIRESLKGYEIKAIDLQTRQIVYVTPDYRENKTFLKMLPISHDIVYIMKKKMTDIKREE